MSGLASFKHKCFSGGKGGSEDHRESDVTSNGILTEKSKTIRQWDYCNFKYPYLLVMCCVFRGKLCNSRQRHQATNKATLYAFGELGDPTPNLSLLTFLIL